VSVVSASVWPADAKTGRRGRGDARSDESHQKDDQFYGDECRDDEEDCEQMLIDELHVRQVGPAQPIPIHFPAKAKTISARDPNFT
jgi:hypothetical protein